MFKKKKTVVIEMKKKIGFKIKDKTIVFLLRFLVYVWSDIVILQVLVNYWTLTQVPCFARGIKKNTFNLCWKMLNVSPSVLNGSLKKFHKIMSKYKNKK